MMSREKQIERISHELNMSGKSLDTIIPEECDKIAAILYDAGCRMQSEGRWTYGVDRGDTMKCTLCRRRMPKIDNARYCPNCGAKMTKGGE